MNNNNEPATKKELDKILDNKLHKWTKKEIEPTVESMFDKFGNKMINEVKEIKNEMINEVKEIKNEIVNSNDKIAKVLSDHEDERTAFTENQKNRIEKFEPVLEDYGQRLKVLELQPA